MAQTIQEWMQTVADTIKETNKIDIAPLLMKSYNLGFNAGEEKSKREKEVKPE